MEQFVCFRFRFVFHKTLQPNADELNRIVAQLERAYQESRQRLKQPVQEGGSVTPTNNENQSTLSPNVTGLITALADNKVLSIESAGSTPSITKGTRT